MKIALLSYSTKPRGGVVHTLALAEALAERGEEVTVWTLGRGGDSGFFRPISPRVEQRIVLQRKADTALKATDEGVRGS